MLIKHEISKRKERTKMIDKVELTLRVFDFFLEQKKRNQKKKIKKTPRGGGGQKDRLARVSIGKGDTSSIPR